jgi:hypothetical protein
MMRYYIILQPTIKSMGGEEMYTRNIIISAREHGYVPIVFHSGIGEKIYIEDLKPYEKYAFSEFRYDPCVIPKWKKKKILNKICKLLVDYDDGCIVESHEILVAEWGELIAKRLNARHLVYMLLEHNTLTNKSLYDFFKYKYDRKELVGIVNNTIPDMFSNFDKNVIGYSLPAYCQNVLEPIPCPKEYKINNVDYVIGSIGRTNKRYVQPMIDSVIKFTSKHADKTFGILYVGGSMDKNSENLVRERLSNITNVKFVFTGMMFPLPIEMIKQMDVCLATAGACGTSERCGIPTISIDGNDSKAIGIFNRTTINFLFRDESEHIIEIEKLLEEVLIEGKYLKEDRLEIYTVNLDSHWEFLKEMESKKVYYDISNIRLSFKREIVSCLLGFYYGLKPDSIEYRVIERLINIVK